MSKSDVLERFIETQFSLEKQVAIKKMFEGVWEYYVNSRKLTGEESDLFFAEMEKLGSGKYQDPQVIHGSK